MRVPPRCQDPIPTCEPTTATTTKTTTTTTAEATTNKQQQQQQTQTQTQTQTRTTQAQAQAQAQASDAEATAAAVLETTAEKVNEVVQTILQLLQSDGTLAQNNNSSYNSSNNVILERPHVDSKTNLNSIFALVDHLNSNSITPCL
jgi:regulator of protease activity HflC (stomatin/prohibitin superfamily)